MTIQFHTLVDEAEDEITKLGKCFDTTCNSLTGYFQEDPKRIDDIKKEFHQVIDNWSSTELKDFKENLAIIYSYFLPKYQKEKIFKISKSFNDRLNEIVASTNYSVIFKNLYKNLCYQLENLYKSLDNPSTTFLSGLPDISLIAGTISSETNEKKELKEINALLGNLKEFLIELEKARGAATIISQVESKVSNQFIMNNYYLEWTGQFIDLLSKKMPKPI